MQRYTNICVDRRGNVLPSSQIYVYNGGTAFATMSTIYSDNGVTPVVQPLIADTAGEFYFYAADGQYDLVVAYPGMANKIRYSIELADITPYEFDVTSVRFGAVGDGVADDRAAIQAAIDVVEAEAWGGVILFPPGDYLVSGGLTATLLASGGKTITFRGSGPNASRLIVSGANPGLDLDGWTGVRSERFIVENLGFSSSGATSHAIRLKNTKQGRFYNLRIYGFTSGAGIKIDADDNKYTTQNVIRDCYIEGCLEGIHSDLSATVGSYNTSTVITGCQITTNTNYEIRFNSSGGLGGGPAGGHFISDSWLQNNALGSHGILIDDEVKAVRSSNVNIDCQAATEAITIHDAATQYSMFSNTSADGILVDNSAGAGSEAASFLNAHFSGATYADFKNRVPSLILRPIAEPGVPFEGMLTYRSTDDKLILYNGVDWEILNSHLVANVMDYGATGDGATDDRAAIQATIDAVEAAGGGVVFFPTGLYKVNTSPLTASLVDSSGGTVTFLGAGPQCSKIFCGLGTANLLELDGWYNAKAERFVIRDLGFSMGGAATGADAIYAANVKQCRFDNVRIYGFLAGAGIHLVTEDHATTTYYTTQNTIRDSYIADCLEGVHIDNESTKVGSYNTANVISGCQIGVNTNFEIKIGNSGGAGDSDAHFISDSWLQSTSGGNHGLSIENGTSACKIANVAIDGGPTTTAVTVSGTSNYNSFVNMSVDGGLSDGGSESQFFNCHFTSAAHTDFHNYGLEMILTPVAQPGTPFTGQLIYNTGTNKLNFWNGGAWEVVTSS